MSEKPGKLCSDCGKTYSSVTNLNKHIKIKHSGRKKKEKPGKFYCEHCSKCFPRLFNLQRHVVCYHSERSKPRDFKFFCKLCPCRFQYKTNYNQHLKTKHYDTKQSELKVSAPLQYKCAICDLTLDKKQLLVHFVNNHNMILQETKYTFNSREDFISWKRSYEHDTNSRFVRDYTTARGGLVYEGYKCYHREGKPAKVRIDKNRNGDDHFCPASIKLKITDSEGCTAVVLDTHVGHQLEKRELKVSTSNDDALLTKIPFDELFDELRSSESNLPILTKTDLYKIETSFNLFTSLGEFDSSSLDSWIKNLQDLGDIILFYKAEGCIFESYDWLRQEDFVLVMMTEAQAKMLLQYGSDGVCIDRYPGTLKKCKNLSLVTILVEDVVGEVFPCGFLISNKITVEVLKIFFSHVRHKIGMKICPNVFMSDIESGCNKAWSAVMFRPKIMLLSPWRVDDLWRKHLKAKVKPIEKQLAVYQLLCTLFTQTDQETFDAQLQKVYNSFRDDPETHDFAMYFDSYFMSKETSCWAFFHNGLNTNMCFEKFHRVLKCIHLMGQQVKRFDKTIGAIMRLVRDKYVDGLTDLDPTELMNKKQDICSRHETSFNMDLEVVTSVDNGVWNILSSDQTKLHAVRKIKDECDCQLKCIKCNSCLHQYICSCIDASIRYNMCKHIHLICRHPESVMMVCVPTSINKNAEVTIIEDSNGGADENNDCVIEIIDDVKIEDESTEIEKTRRELQSDFDELNKLIENADSKELLTLQMLLTPLKASLEAVKKTKTFKQEV